MNPPCADFLLFRNVPGSPRRVSGSALDDGLRQISVGKYSVLKRSGMIILQEGNVYGKEIIYF